MARLGTVQLETASGPVDLPVFDVADVENSMVRVMTPSGVGAIPFVAPVDADYPALRLQTSGGVLAATGTLPSDGGGGGGGGGGGDPGDGGGGGTTTTGPGNGTGGDGIHAITTPEASPTERCARAGLDIGTTKTVTRTSQIGGDPHTKYVVDGNDGPLTVDDGKHDLGTVEDVAIVGKNDPKIEIPAGMRDYAIVYSGGSGALWSGIDIDQTNPNAWGRINMNVADNGTIERVKTIGRGREEGYDPASPARNGVGPTLHLPATSSSGLCRVRNVEIVHGGIAPDEHYGSSPLGIFLATEHNGTLHIADSRFADFPGDGLYATNTTGRVVCDNVRWDTCATAGGRIAKGSFTDCVVTYNYNDTTLANADTPRDGCDGFVVGAKAGQSGVDLIRCTVRMENVVKSGAGINVARFADNDPAHVGRIANCDVHIENTGNATNDVQVYDTCSINRIENTTFQGSKPDGIAVENNSGSAIEVTGNSIDYPTGRAFYDGPVIHV